MFEATAAQTLRGVDIAPLRNLADEDRTSRARRITLAVLAALITLTGLALIAWGPVPAGALTHQHADNRSWLGIPNAANVLVNVPIFWCAAWGWCATRTSPWTRSLRLPWQGFHLWVMLASLLAAMYHAAPSDAGYIASHVCSAGAALMLSFGLMAERLDRRWGAMTSCVLAALVVVAIGVASDYEQRLGGGIDVRPFLLLQAVPLLLVVAGTLRLPPDRPRRSAWVVLLALYAGARLLEWADAPVFTITGWISGHTLMHACTGLIVAWMAYRASTEVNAGIEAAGGSSGLVTQRSNWLNTSG